MERRLPKSAALIALTVFASGCTPGTIGAAGSPTGTTNDSPHGATAPDHSDRRPDQDPTAADEGTDDKGIQSKIDGRGLAQDANTRPRGAAAEPERPSAHNTGPTDRGALVPSGNLTISTNGAVVEDLDITGMVTIDADNVTLRNFRVTAPSYYGIKIQGDHSGILIEDGEISNAISTAILGVGYTGRRLYIHDVGDGMKIQGSGGPTVVEWSFVEKLTGAHNDAVQTDFQGPSSITLRYNNFWLPSSGTPPYPAGYPSPTSCVITKESVHDYVIENNWLTGGSYTIYCEPGILVRNNRFGRYNRRWVDGREGEVLRTGTCGEWSGNVWEDTGDPI